MSQTVALSLSIPAGVVIGVVTGWFVHSERMKRKGR